MENAVSSMRKLVATFRRAWTKLQVQRYKETSSKLDYVDERFLQRVDVLIQREGLTTSRALVGITHGAITHKVVNFYRRLDELSQPFDAGLACTVGCNYCCHYHVLVTPVEVFAIVEHLRLQGDSVVAKTIDDLRIYLSHVSGLTPLEHKLTNIPCVFLQEGLCSIYAIRPIACRGHHSASLNFCKRSFEDPISDKKALRGYDRSVVSTAFDNLSLAIQHKSGLDSSKYEFHAATFEALTDSSSLKRWKDGKSAFSSVKDKVSLHEMLSKMEG